jgi:hypothetical protein
LYKKNCGKREIIIQLRFRNSSAGCETEVVSEWRNTLGSLGPNVEVSVIVIVVAVAVGVGLLAARLELVTTGVLQMLLTIKS